MRLLSTASLTAAAAAMAIGVSAGGPAVHMAAVRPEPPRIYAPAEAGMTRRQRVRAEKTRRRRLEHARNTLRNAERAARRPGNPNQSTINRLTNWQRNQWARAGYPWDVARFAAMVRPHRLGALALLA